jgi:hypothetical protein
MLAGLDGGGEMDGTESRWGGQNHQVDPRLEHFLIGIETRKPAIFRHVDPGCDFAVFLQVRQAIRKAVWERISHGDQLDIVGHVQGLTGGAGASAAASDEPDLDGVVGSAVGRPRNAERSGGQGRGRRLQKTTPRTW